MGDKSKRPVTIYLPPSADDWLRKEAARLRVPKSTLVADAVAWWRKQDPRDRGKEAQ